MIRGEPEGCGGIAAEHAPAPLQFLAHGLFQRVAPGVVILAGSDEVAIERARPGIIEQRKRVGPAVEIDGELAQTDEIGAAGHAAQRRAQIVPQRARRPGIARSGRAEQRRVVVGEIEIGEFDDPDAVLPAADQRQQRRLFAGHGVGDDGDQRLDLAGEGAIPGCIPLRMLERGRRIERVPARHGLRPAGDQLDAIAARAGGRPRGKLACRCREDRHFQGGPFTPPSAGRRSRQDGRRRGGSRSCGARCARA